MKTLKLILTEQVGFITQPQMAEIAEYFPNMEILIRRSDGRELICAKDVSNRVLQIEQTDGIYLRDVCLTASKYEALCMNFNI